MLGLSDRKMSELRGKELRAILDPAGREGYKAEVALLEQWLQLDDKLAAGTAPAPKRCRPRKIATGRDIVAGPRGAQR